MREVEVPSEDVRANTERNPDHVGGGRTALLRYVREVAEGDADAASAAFAATVEDAPVVGVTLLVTRYVAAAPFLDALEVPLAEEFVDWYLDEV